MLYQRRKKWITFVLFVGGLYLTYHSGLTPSFELNTSQSLPQSLGSHKLEPVSPDEQKKIKDYYTLSKSVINPIDNFTFLYSNHRMCPEGVYFIALIPSAAQNFKRRAGVRDSYGRFGRPSHQPIYSKGGNTSIIARTVFMIGLNKDPAVNEMVKQEAELNKDMIVADFVDSYYNLTLKVLLGLKWIGENCNGVKYVLKADDDVFVHIPLLLEAVEKFTDRSNGSVFGHMLRNRQITTIGKWGISKSEYPLEFYPDYAQGTSYTLTGNLVNKIVKTAQYLPYLHNEDVFITGVLASKIHGAKLHELAKTSRYIDEVPSPCIFVRCKRLAQTKTTPELMTEIWKTIQQVKRTGTCEDPKADKLYKGCKLRKVKPK